MSPPPPRSETGHERSRDVPTRTAPGGLPLIGHGLQLARNPLPFISSLRNHGSVVRIRIGPTPAYVVTDPALTRKVLVTAAWTARTKRSATTPSSVSTAGRRPPAHCHRTAGRPATG
ncbi:hypothetical protein AB0929_36790 [Streptomyces massasporeus]|uniref:hypothetical protein n=1 Tax=Streptomyces massasporeus TaxID=67324 RepID=UPI0034513FE9